MNRVQLLLPEMESILSPVPVAWVGLCPQCDRVVAGALILPKEERYEDYLTELQRTLGEWTAAGMVVQKVYARPTIDGCIRDCTWKPESYPDLEDEDYAAVV